MKKLSITPLLTTLFVLGLAGLALAADDTQVLKVEGLRTLGMLVVAAGFGIALASVGTGIAQGIAIKGSVEGMARNPEAAGKLTTTMIIGLALIESLCIYTLVVALILLFTVAPNLQKFVGVIS